MIRCKTIEEFDELKKTNNHVLLVNDYGFVKTEFIRIEHTWFYDYFMRSTIKYMSDAIISLILDFEKYSLYINSETIISTKLEGKPFHIYIEDGQIYFSSTFGHGINKLSIEKLHLYDKEKVIKIVDKVIKDIKESTLKQDVKDLILKKYLVY